MLGMGAFQRPWTEALGLGNGKAAKDSHRRGKLEKEAGICDTISFGFS